MMLANCRPVRWPKINCPTMVCARNSNATIHVSGSNLICCFYRSSEYGKLHTRQCGKFPRYVSKILRLFRGESYNFLQLLPVSLSHRMQETFVNQQSIPMDLYSGNINSSHGVQVKFWHHNKLLHRTEATKFDFNTFKFFRDQLPQQQQQHHHQEYSSDSVPTSTITSPPEFNQQMVNSPTLELQPLELISALQPSREFPFFALTCVECTDLRIFWLSFDYHLRL